MILELESGKLRITKYIKDVIPPRQEVVLFRSQFLEITQFIVTQNWLTPEQIQEAIDRALADREGG